MGVLLVIVAPLAAVLGWVAVTEWRGRRRRRHLGGTDDVKAQLRARTDAESRRYHPTGGSTGP
jgi:hypothetical protein